MEERKKRRRIATQRRYYQKNIRQKRVSFSPKDGVKLMISKAANSITDLIRVLEGE